MSRQRDGFLDVVRAIATIRVVLWHAFGAAALTFVAAMPAMFFVTGTLYTGSADRHGARRTFADRMRRIVPSLWVFALLAWIAMAIGAWRSDTDLPLVRAGLWFLPISDPGGSTWEGGWLATPLWYLRALLWIMLLSPVIIRAVRWRPIASLTVAAATLVGLEVVDRRAIVRPEIAPHVVWQVGDVVLYSTFFALGVLASDGRLQSVSRRRWVAVAAVGAALAALWWCTQPVPDGVVNDSHPMHLFVGVVWLAVAMAAQGWLRTLAHHPASRPVVQFLSRRSLSVYLWHTTAIVVALWFLNRTASLPFGMWTLSYLALIVAGVLVLTAAFGWIEDLGGRRTPRLWPLETATDPTRRWLPVVVPLVAFVAIAVALPLTSGREATDLAFTPRVPSQAPPRPQIADAEPIAALDAFGTTPLLTDIDPERLESVVAAWQADYPDIAGVAASVTASEAQFASARGHHEDGTDRTVADRLDVMSVTKLFTANLVYRAVDSGLLSLDDPVPAIGAEPEFPYAGQMTVRQLLAHRSGIVNYRDSTRYLGDPDSVSTVSDAIASSVADPLLAPPGSAPLYSSTNYLLLGRLLEQVTGVDFDALLTNELLTPLGMASAAHLPPDRGEPRFATAGLVADVTDLGRAGVALLRDHVGVSDESYAAMFDIDVDSGMGPGLNGFCPCQRRVDGGVEWFAVGYTGGSTLLAYIPASDVVVAVDVTGGLYGEHGHFDAVIDLARRLGDASSIPVEGVEPA